MGCGESTNGWPSLNHWTVVAGAGTPENTQLIDTVSSSLVDTLTGWYCMVGGANEIKDKFFKGFLWLFLQISKYIYWSLLSWLEWWHCEPRFQPDIGTFQCLGLKRDSVPVQILSTERLGSRCDQKVLPTKRPELEVHPGQYKSTRPSNTRQNSIGRQSMAVVDQSRL